MPSAFVDEIEELRMRVEELSDEVSTPSQVISLPSQDVLSLITRLYEQRSKLKDELSTQLAQANTFRSLPNSVSINFVRFSDIRVPSDWPQALLCGWHSYESIHHTASTRASRSLKVDRKGRKGWSSVASEA